MRVMDIDSWLRIYVEISKASFECLVSFFNLWRFNLQLFLIILNKAFYFTNTFFHFKSFFFFILNTIPHAYTKRQPQIRLWYMDKMSK